MMIITISITCVVPEGTKRATSVNVATSAPAEGSAHARHGEFLSELRRRRSGVFTEVAHWVPPDLSQDPSGMRQTPSPDPASGARRLRSARELGVQMLEGLTRADS